MGARDVSARQVCLWAFQSWAIVGMAIPAAVCLYGQLSHDSFLSFLFYVKDPSSLDKVSEIANVFALTGLVLFTGLFTAVGLFGSCVRMDTIIDIPMTLIGGLVCIDCWRIGHLKGRESQRFMAVIVLALLILKWTPPVQRYFRKHVRFLLLPAFFLGTTFYFWMWKDMYPTLMVATAPGYPDSPVTFPFYEAKPWAQFDSGDKFLAAFGLAVFLAAAFLWKWIKTWAEKPRVQPEPSHSSPGS